MGNLIDGIWRSAKSMADPIHECQEKQPDQIKWMIAFAIGVGIDKITPIVPAYVNGGRKPAFGLAVLLIVLTPIVLIAMSRKIECLDEIPPRIASWGTKTSAVAGMVAVVVLPVTVNVVLYLVMIWMIVYTPLLLGMSNRWVIEGLFRTARRI